jgi:hypothetical protein
MGETGQKGLISYVTLIQTHRSCIDPSPQQQENQQLSIAQPPGMPQCAVPWLYIVVNCGHLDARSVPGRRWARSPFKDG